MLTVSHTFDNSQRRTTKVAWSIRIDRVAHDQRIAADQRFAASELQDMINVYTPMATELLTFEAPVPSCRT